MEVDCSSSVPNAEANQIVTRPEVSVIVPVYNVEPYLRRCVDSLMNQTLQNIEIILVDDGSTDGGGRICDEYAAKDARIRVVHQENAGLSEARNAGIDCARANYLMFVDSDDWVEPDFYRIPLTITKEQHADLVMFQFRDLDNGIERIRHYAYSEGIKTEVEALSHIFDGVGLTAWNKLYHRDLFRKNRFPKGMVYEDVVLTPILVHESKKTVYTSATLYNHERRFGNITTTLSEKNSRDYFHAHRITVQHLKGWGFSSIAEQYYQSFALGFVGRDRHCPEFTSKCTQYLRSLKRCPSHFSFKQRIKLRLLVISPKLYRLVFRAYCLLRP